MHISFGRVQSDACLRKGLAQKVFFLQISRQGFKFLWNDQMKTHFKSLFCSFILVTYLEITNLMGKDKNMNYFNGGAFLEWLR